MSMTVAQQSPSMTWSFDEDKGNNSLVSLSGMTQSTYGAYTPAPVELVSNSSISRKGVARMNITIRVPMQNYPDATGAGADVVPVTGTNTAVRTRFAQVSLSINLPNNAGILGSTAASSGVPQDVVSGNLAAVTEGLSILLNLICNQNSGVLAAGKYLVSPANTSGLLDSSNPIVRGLAGVIPIDPNANRAISVAS